LLTNLLFMNINKPTLRFLDKNNSHYIDSKMPVRAKMKTKNIKFIALFFFSILQLSASWPSNWLDVVNKEPLGSLGWMKKELIVLKQQASNIDNRVLRLSLAAYLRASKIGLYHKPVLTVIDYSKPSNEKRLWVFDLQRNRTLFNTWVSHGKNSGGITANSFSNRVGSLKSSIGVFMTDKPYMGGNGYSLRLKGLEHGINDNAYKRNVVIHGAWYVGSNTLQKYGKIGRSWGCPAVDADMAKSIINTIQKNTLLVAYYPDPKWLLKSIFLTS
jgi:hypothetical protein